MEESAEFMHLVLNSIEEHIAVIDVSGVICFVNQSWLNFGDENQCLSNQNWTEMNYLNICDQASSAGDDFGHQAGAGIRKVISGQINSYSLEYPCHSDEEHRWFIMHVSPFEFNKANYFVITHQDVTERKLAELAVKELVRLDGLTDIYNRRAFDEFLQQEWVLCLTLQQPISLAVIDLDHFKQLNDSYGHLAGDDCLKQIAQRLKKLSDSPRFWCARYGGEEFALIMGNTDVVAAKQVCDEFTEQIHRLNIPNIDSPVKPYITASIGLAEVRPTDQSNAVNLLNQADTLLYTAKEKGRNRIEISCQTPDLEWNQVSVI
ncbi:sensor domain-containing diguanylate cyclase [Marinomonas posidonica]|uniref:diguanylate cyclase n=1 Tax=Marinomonas posidonica (strain CECT 7376 / NCIMB 14433 / IVIA-Po-181) TaxID=491952 RepID=F6CSZ6_MARPP|nr:sensor domain-containing diguanylate cyclase [Marinomonas posidonica]AEF55054.1 diguanylate cyclase with PAS/PAC sensor [Marinomonas posidonica IVIA-Po-181]